MPADRFLLNRLFQMFLIWLKSGSVVMAWSRWAEKIWNFCSSSRFGWTWSVLVICISYWWSWISEWLISVVTMCANSGMMNWHRVSWISMLITARSALVLRSDSCFFLVQFSFLSRLSLRQLIRILFCNPVEFSFKALLCPIFALIFFVWFRMISFAWF
jgi:hypothetical protein